MMRGAARLVSKMTSVARQRDPSSTAVNAMALFAELIEPVDLGVVCFLYALTCQNGIASHLAPLLSRRESSDYVVAERSFRHALIGPLRMLCRRVFPALYAFDVCCTLLRLARAPVPRQLPWCVAALAYGACGSELLRALKRAGLARLLPLQLDKAAAAPLSKDEFDAQRVSWSNRLDTVDRIGDVVVWTASGLVLLEVLSVECGFALTSILAFGGVGSVVLGLACQTPLSNVVSGVLVALTNPFGVGDEVLIGGGGSDELVGYVDQLGWYSTRLRGYDDRVIIIPNRLIDGRTAVNYSRMRHKRLNAELRLRPDDAPRVLDVVKKLRARIGTLPRVIDDRANNLALRVYLARYMDSSPVIDVEVHWEGNNKDEFFAWRERALVVVKDAIEDAGCQLFRPPVPPPPPKPPA